MQPRDYISPFSIKTISGTSS